MTVPPLVSRNLVRQELEEAQHIIGALGLHLHSDDLRVDHLRFRVSGHSRQDRERYIVEFQCDGYPDLPPLVEMIDPQSGQPGTRYAYPRCFHAEPCICARFNRKAYGGYTGLHSEWEHVDWSRDGNTNHLGGMINYIFSRIHGYTGEASGRQG